MLECHGLLCLVYMLVWFTCEYIQKYSTTFNVARFT